MLIKKNYELLQWFTIVIPDNILQTTKDIQGKLVKIEGSADEYFIHYNYTMEDWCLCEVSVGMLIVRGKKSEQEIVEFATKIIKENVNRWPEIKSDYCKKSGIIKALNTLE